VIEAIANDAPSEAGANQGSTGWDELWGYTSERSLRLWEELTPVPNKPSVRFVTTYAGWENESKLLWDLYLASVGPDEHPQGQAERIHADLPIYLNSESGILATGTMSRECLGKPQDTTQARKRICAPALI
jgi:hypothetical protein